MTEKELRDALDGLYAYDTGSIDSGIKDEGLRQKCIDYLHGLDENAFRLILSHFVREYFLSDKALEQGYGIEDVASFVRWLSNFMDIDL